MGEFKVYLGQDDLEEFAKFGADMGIKAKAALQDMGKFINGGYSTSHWNLGIIGEDKKARRKV